MKSKFKKSVFWLAWDFNLPDIDLENFSSTGHQYSRSINQLFLDLTYAWVCHKPLIGLLGVTIS